MTATAVTDKARARKAEVPVQVPVHDPLYTHVIGSLEQDLSTARDRCRKAENKVAELSKINVEVELLREQVEHMRREFDEVKRMLTSTNEMIEHVHKVINRAFRS